MTYAEKTSEWLVGKTIKKANVDGHCVSLDFTDGTSLYYDASDGGYSSWNALPYTSEIRDGMVIDNGTIVETTESALYQYYLSREWDNVYSFPEFRRLCEENGTKIIKGGK